MRSVSVDGDSIVASARCALEKALSRSEARDSARKAATLREIERVTQLKKLRGEKWLPSLAREMQVDLRFPNFSKQIEDEIDGDILVN